MRRTLVLLALLAACGTPQEQCINRVTRDLRIVDRLIAETEGNLARGYAYEDVIVYRPVRVICDYYHRPGPADGGPAPRPVPRYCWDEREYTEQRPTAIDLRAERSKLEGLRAKRVELSRSAATPIAQCQAQYPE